MLTIRDLAQQEEMLTDFKELSRNRKVNGEKTISMSLFPTRFNAHSFPLVEEESTITFEGEEYVIKKLAERNIGNASYKQATAVHKFYVDLINKQQPKIHNGSITFENYMKLVFEGTGYTFVTLGTFLARSFENLGNDNRLALLQKGLDRFKAEMELVGNQVRLKDKVGNDTDFQFRYGHNIKTLEKNVDTTNLATVIRGTGAEGVVAYYRSPNADIFGEIDSPPVNDERFTSSDTLLAEMVSRLQDTPEFSITIDFADLRAAGYPWTVPNEGDRVFVIYEPMNGLEIETRILEINEVLNADLKPIKTNVTLANYKKSFAGTMFDNVQKQLRDIVNDDGMIKYNVLDEAVRIATAALQSAQTELEFENGIIARDKNNPNFLVLFNSNGIGISRDGGATFTEAITSDGFVLSAGAIGQLKANNIQIGPETTFESGYDPTLISIGVSNLVFNSTFNGGLNGWSNKTSTIYKVLAPESDKPYSSILNITESGNTDDTLRQTWCDPIQVDADGQKEFTVSVDIKIAKISDMDTNNTLFSIRTFDVPDKTAQADSVWYQNVSRNNLRDLGIVDGKWKRFALTIKPPTGKYIKIAPYLGRNGNVFWREIKLEIGNKATDWTPNSRDVVSQIKDDLRMSAPLPTSLTMNQDGITASTSDPTRYARMDYRGFYAKKGAFAVERPDGYLLVNDGLANFDFSIDAEEPPYMDGGIFVEGIFFKGNNYDWANCNYYSYKHTARYLKVQMYVRVQSGGTGWARIVSSSGGTVLWSLSHNYTAGQGQLVTATVDLGVPTGNLGQFYIQLATSNISQAAYVRVVRKWLEG